MSEHLPVSVEKLTAGSVFSGIEGFGLAAERAGIRLKWSCEIDPDARAVIGYHYPDVPLFEDINDIGAHNLERVDILAGGSPCQNLSVAGRREGLAGEKSILFYEFARLAEELQPTWLVWENVPGALSSNKGEDFRAVLRTLDECGYGLAWRVLDSKNWGVAQRRRRIALVGMLGGPCPEQILFEPEGGEWGPPQSREAGSTLAGDPEGRLRAGGAVAFDWQAGGGANDDSWRGGPRSWTVKQGDYAGALSTSKVQAVYKEGLTALPDLDGIPDPVSTLQGGGKRGYRVDAEAASGGHISPVAALTACGVGTCGADDNQVQAGHIIAVPETAATLTAGASAKPGVNPPGRRQEDDENLVAFHLTQDPITSTEVYPAMTAGTSQGCATLGVGYRMLAFGEYADDESASTLKARDYKDATDLVAYRCHGTNVGPMGTLRAGNGHVTGGVPFLAESAVRRLTPMECERLQSFPDGWTLVPNAKGKPMSDSARYRMLGNAVTVNVFEWVFRRLAAAHFALRGDLAREAA